MLKRKIYYLLIIITSICVITYLFDNSNRINYFIDSIRSYYINFYNKISSSANITQEVNSSSLKKYIKTYNKLPKNYIHSLHFLFYKADRNIRVIDIARESIVYTHFYKTYKLAKAIKEYNALRDNTIKKNMVIYIPYSLPPFQPDITKTKKPETRNIRGLYYTGNSIGDEKILHIIDKYIKVGINAIVFDAKDITGIVNYFSHIPSVQEYNSHAKRTIDDIDKLIKILKKKKIHSIARISIFRDHHMYKKNPALRIKSKKNNKFWNSNSKELWCDPTNKYIQDYNIDIALELAEKGVDEIQFDYIRFPTLGNLSDAKYSYNFGKMSKDETITLFLKRAYNKISQRNTLLSIDIFGVVAWGKEIDIKRTGQRVESLSKYCDIISPMLYPSHFNNNFDGFSNPADNPYYFIYTGCKKVIALSKGKTIRPWIQAFKWRITSYNKEYILEEILACRNSGAMGYLFWNASNNYETVYKALKKMKSLQKNMKSTF